MSNRTPYIGFSNETLAKLLPAKAGDEIYCKCGSRHRLVAADDGSELLLFYRCGDQSFLGAVAGKLVVGTPSDVHGDLG